MASNSTYYQYQDVKRNIVHRLFKLGGWNVYRYHEDNSDLMYDYYDPERWGGIAEKNGYVFCVDISTAEELCMGKRRINQTYNVNANNEAKIKKLKEITQARGASKQEEETAKAKIKILMGKSSDGNPTSKEEYEEYITTPKHMANPPRCNWHIEKDGIIIDKGTGLLKFSNVPDIMRWEDELQKWQEFNRTTRKEYVDEYVSNSIENGTTKWYSIEEITKWANSSYDQEEKKYKLLEEFNEFISRVDSACGNRCGEPEFEYKTVKKTKYKKENKAVEKSQGEIKDGQCFIIKGYFNHGVRKGNVYRIHDSELYKGVSAYKLNRKLAKECKGRADSSNRFWVRDIDKFKEWIDKGFIAWCEIVEEKVPYTIEAVEKVPIKKAQKNNNNNKSKEPKGEKNMAKKKTEAKSKVAYEIKDGTREGAFEVYFAEKPDQKVIDALKELKMRWHRQKKCWYGFHTKEEIKSAINVA